MSLYPSDYIGIYNIALPGSTCTIKLVTLSTLWNTKLQFQPIIAKLIGQMDITKLDLNQISHSSE